jgi:hypothetical protein
MIMQNDPRRWKERADGSMVAEDHGAMANLSPDVMAREIPHHDIPINPATVGNVPDYGRPKMDMQTIFMTAAKKKGRAT